MHSSFLGVQFTAPAVPFREKQQKLWSDATIFLMKYCFVTNFFCIQFHI